MVSTAGSSSVIRKLLEKGKRCESAAVPLTVFRTNPEVCHYLIFEACNVKSVKFAALPGKQ